jgi:hypothetical protein
MEHLFGLGVTQSMVVQNNKTEINQFVRHDDQEQGEISLILLCLQAFFFG